ncbi:MAG: S41 family peptidase [Cytophagales bacterium]|nr:S41 family peptidase [Cytophagales bacterium]
MKRGDRINRINGMPLTLSNYKNLLSSISEEHLLTYQSLDLASQAFGAEQELKVSSVVYAENPNFLTKIFEYNDRKVGYYIYNLFSVGPTSTSTQYNDEMDQVFAGFQSAGITDLILDLRFNSGGAETASTNLASLVGKDVDATKIFSFREYNADVTATIKKDPKLIDQYLSVEFVNKSQNIGSQLRDSRVYILTGSRTASASELLINGLRPYMDVFLIGNKTVGKNVGSITLNEENNPNNTWGMQPIVSKSFNSLNQSDYSTGFNPQILLDDNSEFPYPLGDPQERLLNRALQEITGETNSGRLTPYNPMGAEAGHSLDLKKRSNVLLLDLVVQNSLRNLLENQ